MEYDITGLELPLTYPLDNKKDDLIAIKLS